LLFLTPISALAITKFNAVSSYHHQSDINMKTSLFFGVLWFALASFFAPLEPSFITGKVTDGSGEPLIGASVRVLQGTANVTAGITNMEGQFKLQVAPGNYTVEVSYTGYATKRYTEIAIAAGKTYVLNAMLEAQSLSEVVITRYEVPLIEFDKTSGGQVLNADDIKRSTIKDRDERAFERKKTAPKMAPAKTSRSEPAKPAEVADKVPAVYAPASGALKPVTTAAPEPAPLGEVVVVDGIRMRHVVTFDAETYEEKMILAPAEDGEGGETTPGIIPQPKPRAGLLTAGEWNDLHNWNRHWLDLIADGEIAAYEDMYGFFARQRYTVILTNEQDFPLADVPVQLKNGDEIVWEARTDNTGKVELWAGLYDKKAFENLTTVALLKDKKMTLGKPKAAKDGFNFHKIKAECFAPTNVDIMWAVDATGSMGDEIEYLKTEVLDVIERAKRNNPALSFQMGTAFYRDKGDEYIVKSSGLSADISRTVDFIQQQFAGGGGDYPEAVHSALEEVVYRMKWRENAIARICFLVLDASPHQRPEVTASLQKTIKEAARLGIRIVPVAASGIQKDTEFLMKFFGLATNGSYVFLTDHSGVGGKHLEPTSDEYKVEPFNDLLVRIITEYTTMETCEGKSNIRFDEDPQQQPGNIQQATYFPNPAVDQFILELPFEVQSVTLYDSEGKSVRKLEKLPAGQHTIPINDLSAGFYTLRILHNGRLQSGKLMVVKS
jgi:Carboxypeptidase regulatory-like domain/Secretion system C-terminal sorting domain